MATTFLLSQSKHREADFSAKNSGPVMLDYTQDHQVFEIWNEIKELLKTCDIKIVPLNWNMYPLPLR